MFGMGKETGQGILIHEYLMGQWSDGECDSYS